MTVAGETMGSTPRVDTAKNYIQTKFKALNEAVQSDIIESHAWEGQDFGGVDTPQPRSHTRQSEAPINMLGESQGSLQMSQLGVSAIKEIDINDQIR